MYYKFISIIFALLLLSSTALNAVAEDLGVIGPTYEIIERDLIETIQKRFMRMEQSGELSKMQEDYKRRVVDSIERPRPVPGIRSTEVARTFYIDPTYTLAHNVQDSSGKILYPAGTKINPFDYERMNKVLLFFDGRDEKQVAFAKRFIAESKMSVKPILIAGEPLKLMREWKTHVYYDQGGALTRRLSITQSPAIVSQEGKMIRVDEIRP